MSEPPNPYEPGPSADPAAHFGDLQGGDAARPADLGMVRQVPVVAILMIIQGSLEVLVGIFFMILGPAMGSIIRQAEQQNPSKGPPPEEVMWILMAVYGGMGLIGLIAGVLKIAGGVQTLRFKNRVLGFVALGSCIASLATCYCIPTAIGLGIYGTIVLASNDVGRAFELARQGYTPEQIKSGTG